MDECEEYGRNNDTPLGRLSSFYPTSTSSTQGPRSCSLNQTLGFWAMAAIPEKHTAGWIKAHEISLPLTTSLQSSRTYQLILRPFAGRIGGNQHFILEPDTPEKRKLLQRIPDAAPYLTWKESFDIRPFGELELWKQAFAECYGALFPHFDGV
jgi:hypothetical protein